MPHIHFEISPNSCEQRIPKNPEILPFWTPTCLDAKYNKSTTRISRLIASQVKQRKRGRRAARDKSDQANSFTRVSRRRISTSLPVSVHGSSLHSCPFVRRLANTLQHARTPEELSIRSANRDITYMQIPS